RWRESDSLPANRRKGGYDLVLVSNCPLVASAQSKTPHHVEQGRCLERKGAIGTDDLPLVDVYSNPPAKITHYTATVQQAPIVGDQLHILPPKDVVQLFEPFPIIGIKLLDFPAGKGASLQPLLKCRLHVANWRAYIGNHAYSLAVGTQELP